MSVYLDVQSRVKSIIIIYMNMKLSFNLHIDFWSYRIVYFTLPLEVTTNYTSSKGGALILEFVKKIIPRKEIITLRHVIK